MEAQQLQSIIAQSIGQQIAIEQEGNNRYLVLSPFTMEDGDHFNIVLRGYGETGNWMLTDEGETLLHLSYWMDYKSLKKGTRQDIIQRILSQYGLGEREGEITLNSSYDNLASAIFTFLQALTRISDISFLSREQARATFMEDFRDLLRRIVPEDKLVFDYNHPHYDKQQIYKVDALVKRDTDAPLYVFAVANNDRCRDVTINLHTYRTWNINYQSLAIFENQQSISRDVLARFSDIADKQFSSLVSSEAQIVNYLQRYLAA